MESHGSESTDRPRAPRLGEAALVVALGIGALAAGGWWLGRDRAAPTAPAVDPYIGTESCAGCHPAESARHDRSGHSRTFRPAGVRRLAAQLDGRTVVDPEDPEAAWTYHHTDGRLAVDRAEAASVERLLIEFALGSGRHATTFVTLDADDPARPSSREHRLTHFAHDDHLGITPGQTADDPGSGTGPLGRDLGPELTLRCFGCHTTRTSAEGPDRLDPSSWIANVECERCHGPARAHVEAARRGDEGPALALPFGPGRWTTENQLLMCGDCHRHPTQAPPGALRADNPEIARFQPVGLMLSACFRGSEGVLSCVNCHDPHARSSTDRPGYDARCLGCHDAAPRSVCPVSPATGCVDCHMPRVDAGQGVLFTDHWIRRPADDP